MLAIGQFLKTFGVNGFIRFRSYSGEFDHLPSVKTFYIEPCSIFHKRYKGTEVQPSYEVAQWHIGCATVVHCKIVGFNSPEEVQCLVGKSMYVPREQATKCKQDEYYISDLIGMRVIHGGTVQGMVTAVFTDVHMPLLEVQITYSTETIQNTEIPVKKLIPFMRHFVSKPQKVLEVNTPNKSTTPYVIELYDITLLE